MNGNNDPKGAPRRPSIGRIVHYHFDADEHAPNDGNPCPAIVTAVHSDEYVNLRLFSDGPPSVTIEWRTSVPYAENPVNHAGECWTWPQRV